jgi:hypothetical protein
LGIFIDGRGAYNIPNLAQCLNDVGIYCGADGNKLEQLYLWMQSSRVVNYFKQKKFPAYLYDYSKKLDDNNKKYIKSLIVLYLSEVLGEDSRDVRVQFMSTGSDEMVMTLFQEPGGIVDYDCYYDSRNHSNKTSVEKIYIRRLDSEV